MILIFSLMFNTVFANEKATMPKGKIESPYEACKNLIIVDKDEYQKKKADWDRYEKSCGQKIILSENFGVTSIKSLQKSMENYDFAGKVTGKVLDSLAKSRKYSECSALCFGGAKTCPADPTSDSKAVNCDDRKKEVISGLLVNTRKIRMELALSSDGPGMVNVNIGNVLQTNDEKLINTNLRDFEVGTPNPVGKTELTERELKEAKRRLTKEKSSLQDEFKKRGLKNYTDWMSVKMMERFEEHQKRYRQLIYEEAPIFGVIDAPKKYDERNDPVWTEDQIKTAFQKLSENASKTEEKVRASIKQGKLEYDRYNGEALGKWIKNMAPGTAEEHDLLFYINMKNQVEEVLKEHPSFCGVATSLYNRINSKDTQNSALSFAGSVASLGIAKGASSVASRVFHVGRALTGAEAAGLTGLAMGSTFLGDSFRQYSSAVQEATTKSGIGGVAEGSKLGDSEKIASTRDNLKLSLMTAPLDAIGGWKAGKTLYSSLAKEMEKDLPQAAALVKAGGDTAARDGLVDQWLGLKIKQALKSGFLRRGDEELFKTSEGRKVLDRLVAEMEKSNPDFFKNPENMDFFFKTVISQMKKEKGDPSDLPEKTEALLKMFDTQLLADSADPSTKRGMLEVYDSAVSELRESFQKDPATYAKFTSDREAQEKVMTGAMRRLGLVDEQEAKFAVQCALPKR